ncbi:uncharacterized protein [Phyllobates terribilis]|uniref:uncharacterized protein n=1 Tax=Phyllobates terribilis TaxID=111132 RepID=UPI003CCA8A0B
MKITLAFLFLGICLALTNAASVRKRKMTESEAFSHGRLMSLVIKGWSEWQNCHTCSDREKYCMEKNIIENLCFILKMIPHDMECTLQEFLVITKFQGKFPASFWKAFENSNTETLVEAFRTHRTLNLFIEHICASLNLSLKLSNVDMSGILLTVNSVTNGGLRMGLSCLQNVFGSILLNVAGGLIDAVSGIAGGLGHAVGGVAGGFGNAVGGVAGGFGHAVGGVAGGFGHAVGGVADGLGHAVGGVAGGFGHAAGGVAGGLANSVIGVAGGLGNAVNGVVGGLGNAVGGAVGGLGNAVGGVANTATRLVGGILKG